MGHFVLIVLHLAALVFMLPALFLTVPLHLIYGVMAARGSTQRTVVVTLPPPAPSRPAKPPVLGGIVRGLLAGCGAALLLLWLASLMHH